MKRNTFGFAANVASDSESTQLKRQVAQLHTNGDGMRLALGWDGFVMGLVMAITVLPLMMIARLKLDVWRTLS